MLYGPVSSRVDEGNTHYQFSLQVLEILDDILGYMLGEVCLTYPKQMLIGEHFILYIQ